MLPSRRCVFRLPVPGGPDGKARNASGAPAPPFDSLQRGPNSRRGMARPAPHRSPDRKAREIPAGCVHGAPSLKTEPRRRTNAGGGDVSSRPGEARGAALCAHAAPFAMRGSHAGEVLEAARAPSLKTEPRRRANAGGGVSSRSGKAWGAALCAHAAPFAMRGSHAGEVLEAARAPSLKTEPRRRANAGGDVSSRSGKARGAALCAHAAPFAMRGSHAGEVLEAARAPSLKTEPRRRANAGGGVSSRSGEARGAALCAHAAPFAMRGSHAGEVLSAARAPSLKTESRLHANAGGGVSSRSGKARGASPGQIPSSADGSARGLRQTPPTSAPARANKSAEGLAASSAPARRVLAQRLHFGNAGLELDKQALVGLQLLLFLFDEVAGALETNP